MTAAARAWTGIVTPPIAWFVFEQGLSALLHADCRLSWIGIVWGLTAVGICGGAFHIAWPSRHAISNPSDAWLARLAPVIAGLFTLAILFQTLAVAVVPSCVG